MKVLALLAIVLTTSDVLSRQVKPSERPVDHFQVEGASRLAALAKLGALTDTTLLVEAGDLAFLQAPVVLTADHTTVAMVIREILRGLDSYEVRNKGALLILSTPGQPNRILNLPLGAFSFTGNSISSLHPFLAYSIRRATGCNPQGYRWAGPPMNLNMLPIQLAHATFERILTRVPTRQRLLMWVVGPEPSSHGCIHDPASRWQVGLYGYGRGFSGCRTPFRESVRPPLVIDLQSGRGSENGCTGVHLSNPVPSVSPTGP